MLTKIYYNPTPEVMEELKPKPQYGICIGDELERSKVELEVFVMQQHAPQQTTNVYDQIVILLQSIHRIMKNRRFRELYDEYKEQGNVILCGDNFNIDWDLEDTINRKAREFTLLTMLTETQSMLDEESNYYRKLNQVEEELESLMESFDKVIHQDLQHTLSEYETNREEYQINAI